MQRATKQEFKEIKGIACRIVMHRNQDLLGLIATDNNKKKAANTLDPAKKRRGLS